MRKSISILAAISLLILTACAGNRTQRYTARPAEAARGWQQGLRSQLLDRLRLTDLAAARGTLLFNESLQRSESNRDYTVSELWIRSTPGRFMKVVVAKPLNATGPLPAVVCIHGHQGSRWTPFSPIESIYKCFGEALVKKGFVVISTDVGQHLVYEQGRTLMGERLWDCTRCVDYLRSLPEVDPKRIGCAGLSLGGEMAMWLGAMDERVAATVSAGFLTYMDQMEHNHCLCWKFDGLRELVDYPDLYAMIAPRALQCQNGLKEGETQFTVPLARKAMAEVQAAYRDLGVPNNAELDVHGGAHEIDLPAMLRFLEEHLH